MSAPRIVARLLLIVAGASLALLPGAARAQTAGEHIRVYDVRIEIQPDGSLAVVEQIQYDFDGNQRHGIVRDLIDRLEYDDRYDRVFPVDDIAVSATEGTPAQFETEREGNTLRIRIGDPDRTITGVHTYTILYRVRGALNGFTEHDELYWNAVGPLWNVPIEVATVRVAAPEGIQQIACFAGPQRSSLPCSTSRFDGREAVFQHDQLLASEGMTVVVALPTGAVASPQPILVERWNLFRAFSATPVTIGLSTGLFVLLAGTLGFLFWRNGRDRRAVGSAIDAAYAAERGPEQHVPLFESGRSPVEYTPPEDIRPGQLGTLVDEVAHPLDVSATIVDLAVRGYLRIEEIPKRWFLGKADWRLVKLQETESELLSYERVLFDGLFEDPDEDEPDEAEDLPPRPDAAPGYVMDIPSTRGITRVKLSGLRKRFAPRLKRVQDSLYADAVRNRWFAGRPDKTRDRWRGLGLAALVGGDVITGLVAWKTHLGLVPLPVPLAGLALLTGARWMPHRTAKGTTLVRRVMGFRTYIATAEVQEARFQERENIFSRYLPYAVVFGLTEKWARAFSGLEQAPDTRWYVGARAFDAGAFAGSIDSFAVSTAGTITSTPGGSGGSGFSGGSSGGGGGGGGGGSW